MTKRPAPPRDWDAASYDRISGPQAQWGLALLDRLVLRGDETVLDAGCGSGRVTAMLLERLPRGRVIAVDAAPSMVAHAREALGDRAEVRQVELTALDLDQAVDAASPAPSFTGCPTTTCSSRGCSRR